MDSIDQLLHLRQGGLSIEEYVHQFCELSFQVPLYDEILFKDLFHFGLNRHVKSLFHESLLPGGEFNGSLRGLMDYALLYVGSSFTVGVAEEECDTASLTKMEDAPEGTHKMAEATTHNQFPESHNMPAKPESAHVMPTVPGSVHVILPSQGLLTSACRVRSRSSQSSALQSPCWSRPAHLRLRWSRPAHLRLRWPRPAHLLRWFHPV